jgi:alkylated DNA nucleotide flippase Atl1
MPREMTEFAQRVLDAVDRIPRGAVMSYGDVADYVGQGSARAVGRVMATWGSEVPWHRVLHADGSCADRTSSRQVELLRAEGVPMRGTRVDMTSARWDGKRRRSREDSGRPRRRGPRPHHRGQQIGEDSS